MKRIIFLLALFFSASFYAQNDTLSVVQHTDNSFVIPKDLMVVYRGVENELAIDVPNCKSFEVIGNGITKKDKNIYRLSPGAGSETFISIDIVLKSNKKVTEKHVFKIKNIAATISTFNKIEGNQIIKLQKSGFKNGVVGAKVPDKNIDDLFEVTQFTLKIPGMGAIVIDGNKIDNKTYDILVKKASKGDQITISDIKTRVVKYNFKIMCILTSPMIIQIL